MERIERLEDKIDTLVDKCEKIAIETASNTQSLREHMSQTMEVRKQTEILREIRDNDILESEKRFKKLESFKGKITTVFHTLAYVAAGFVTLEKLGFFTFLFNLMLDVKKIK